MNKHEKEKKIFITKMNGILLALDVEEKKSFISEVVLNLALYGGKDCFEGLNTVEQATAEVTHIIYNSDLKNTVKEEIRIPGNAA